MFKVPTRWRARLALAFAMQNENRCVLASREHEGPLLVQKPLYPEGQSICHVTILHPPAGIAGGDALQIDVEVQPDAHAVLTTPGATIWYKSGGNQASQQVNLRVQAGGRLEWLPLENILFEQADALLGTRVELESGAMAIGWEMSQLGSIVRPTFWDEGRLQMAMQVLVDGSLFWVDQGLLDAQDPLRASRAGLAGLPVHGTLWAFGPRLDPELLDAISVQLPWTDTLRAGLTMLPYDDDQSLYLLRCIGLYAEDVRQLLIKEWMQLRPPLLHTEGVPLRLWST